VYLAKLDSNGGPLWSHTFSGTEHQFPRGLAVDSSDSIVISGVFAGTSNFGGSNLTSAGGGDAFLARYDADGAHQWSKRLGGAASDGSLDVAVGAFGDVIVTGRFAGSVDFGGGHLVSAGEEDIFLARYDADGAHQWSIRFGGNGQDSGQGIAISASNAILLTGSFQDSVNFGGENLVSAGESDLFLARLNADGEHDWSQAFGDIGFDTGHNVAARPSGGFLATGQFEGSVDFGGGGLVSAGEADVFVAAFRESGTTLGGHLDIKPGSCPGALNVKNLGQEPRNPRSNRGGVLPVAVYGSEGFDVTEIDVYTLQLEGVASLSYSLEDVGAPVDGTNECDCAVTESDGHLDLTIKFKKSDVVEALGEVHTDDVLRLTLTGKLLDGTPWESSDCVLIRNR
jgi:hypothetical protein